MHKSVSWWLTGSIITNWGKVLLQIGQLCFITKWGRRYYKLGKLYYKLGQLLQIGAVITNWGITCSQYIVHAFFISNTFTRNDRLKLAKNQANPKQHPETELLLFERYHYHLMIIGHILEKKQKNKCPCIPEIVQPIIMKMKIKV